jgi:hypothetical protein
MTPLTADVDLSDEIQRALDFRFDVPPEAWSNVFTCGTWWVIPFGTTWTAASIGVRLVPGRAPAEFPVIIAAEDLAATVATRPASYVPVAALLGMNRRESWDRIAKLSDAGWNELSRLHTALGGDDAGILALRYVAGDRELRDGIVNDADYDLRVRCMLASLDRLDPAADAIAARQFCRQARATDTATLSTPAAGDWNAWTTAMAFLANRQRRAEGAALQAAWAMMHHPPQLDTQMLEPMPILSPDSRFSADHAIAAARTLIRGAEAAWRSDPLWRAVESLASAGDRYDGAAHLLAADALEKAGRSEHALTALIAASFWSYTASGEATRGDILDAALALARRAGWSACVRALEQMLRER